MSDLVILPPSHAYWQVCGSPPVREATPLPPGARCALCAGEATHGMPIRKWTGADSLVLDKLWLPTSPWICAPCVHTTTWLAPPTRSAKEGQARGPSPTMYSHFLCGDRYENASKGEKPRILGWLRDDKPGPWWCVVADMGKKHLIPWATINGSGRAGSVAFDDQDVEVGDLALVDAMIHLLTVGASKATIETGAYDPNQYTRCADAILAFEGQWGHLRGSGWFALALWLGQRDEAAVEERMAEEKAARDAKRATAKALATKAKVAPAPTPRAAKVPSPKPRRSPAKKETPSDETDRTAEGEAAHADDRDPARRPDAGAQERSEPARSLGPDHEPREGRMPDLDQSERVGIESAPEPAPVGAEPGQLGLFGGAEPDRAGSRPGRRQRVARPRGP